MTVERIKHSGHYVISTVVDGYLFRRTYIGYTRREAIAAYRRDVKAITRSLPPAAVKPRS